MKTFEKVVSYQQGGGMKCVRGRYMSKTTQTILRLKAKTTQTI